MIADRTLPFPCDVVAFACVGLHYLDPSVLATWAFHSQTDKTCINAMNMGEWLAVQIPPERMFEIETKCRALESDPNAGKVAAMLLRQTYQQQEIIQAAVHEIARLELQIMGF